MAMAQINKLLAGFGYFLLREMYCFIRFADSNKK